MQAVFRLIEDYRVDRIDDLVGNFLAAMCGQAVHEQRIGFGELHQSAIHLEGGKDGGARRSGCAA